MRPRVFPDDEEQGKRDDDGKYHKSARPRALTNVRIPQRRNMKRLGVLFAALVVAYFFFKNMPTGLKQASRRPNYGHNDEDSASTSRWPQATYDTQDITPQIPPSKKEGSSSDHSGSDKHWFNGPIKFFKLASSLRAVARTGGGSWANHNVLFAASSLKSASALLPMACEMSILKRNNVHFALMGRDDITMSTLQEVNGVAEGCDITYHDARPDYSVQSSDYRMEVSDAAALSHINNFMHPQVVLIDGSDLEDAFFLKAIKARAVMIDKTLIQLPKNPEQNLMWITRLDSASLSAFNRVSVNIIVHAQASASGSLMRLLRSLVKSDYFGGPPPALSIELPQEIDAPTKEYLKNFKWPQPFMARVEGNENHLTLRHRILQYGMSAEEASSRFLESFYPSNSDNAHVLVLSPQCEVSPLFFHYVKYALLEYKYGAASSNDQSLMGISLELPSTYLNDTTNFFPPFLKDTPGDDSTSTSPFLWQAPNSNAALYFGGHWVELHSFISHYLAATHQSPPLTTKPKKLISTTYPSWLEHVLSLARARGYTLLYPNVANQTSLVTVHNELYIPPEEFSPVKPQSDGKYTDSDDVWTAESSHLSLKHEEKPLAKTSLLAMLASSSILPSLGLMPRLTWEGNEIKEIFTYQTQVDAYVAKFRIDYGRCKAGAERALQVDGRVDDLFCLGPEKKAKPARVEEPAAEAADTLPVLADKSAPIPTAGEVTLPQQAIEEVKHPVISQTETEPDEPAFVPQPAANPVTELPTPAHDEAEHEHGKPAIPLGKDENDVATADVSVTGAEKPPKLEPNPVMSDDQVIEEKKDDKEGVKAANGKLDKEV